MAITFVAAGTLAEDSGSGGNVTPGLPAGIQANDILVLVIHAADNVVCTLPGAYTKKLETNSSVNLRQTVAWARATGSDSAPLVTHTAGNAIGARIVAYRGCITTGDPFSAASAQANGPSASTTITAPTITPANNEMVLFVASGGDNTTANLPETLSGWSGANPTLTEEIDNTSNGLNTNAWWGGIADGLSNGSATGSRTTTSINTPSANGVSVGSLFSLQLAASGSVAVIRRLFESPRGPTSRAFKMFQRRPVVPFSGGDVTVALTGVSSTASVGTLGVDIQVPVTGISSATAIGSVGVQHANALTNVSSATAIGSFTLSTTVALTGIASIGSVGTLVPNTTIALSGVSATVDPGSVVASGGDPPITASSRRAIRYGSSRGGFSLYR